MPCSAGIDGPTWSTPSQLPVPERRYRHEHTARQIALKAGLPVTTSGMTINRFCSSGLQTIATAAQRIIAGEGARCTGRWRGASPACVEMNQHMLMDHSITKPEL